MTFVLELKPETARYIEEQAAQRNMAPEEFAVQLLEQAVSNGNADENKKVDALAEYLLTKNEELYRRLA